MKNFSLIERLRTVNFYFKVLLRFYIEKKDNYFWSLDNTSLFLNILEGFNYKLFSGGGLLVITYNRVVLQSVSLVTSNIYASFSIQMYLITV